MAFKRSHFYLLLLLSLISNGCFGYGFGYGLGVAASSHQLPNAVQLASVYNKQDVHAYLVSEKYDGVRAIWKDGQLRTRAGNIIHAPDWFTKDLPNVWLDGELWWQRGHFEHVSSVVRKQTPIDAEWQTITYMVFDAPNYEDTFEKRSRHYHKLLNRLNLEHVQAVEQRALSSQSALVKLLQHVTKYNAEGLMLHKKSALFENGRSQNILKLKTFMDAEATVLAHLPGKGKYLGMMGSLLVHYVNSQGKTFEFKIGTGFSDEQRRKPPPVGSRITFQYHGFTQKGTPRFASFMHVRERF